MNRKRTIFLAIFFAFVIFIAPKSLLAATIYVNSSTGNDTTGSGTSGSPYKTFHKAYTAASSGDTLNLTGTFSWTDADEAGDSSTTGYSLSKNLTITGQGVASTIIQAHSTYDSADRRVFTLEATGTTTIQDLTVRHGKTGTGGCLIFNVASSTLALSNVEITKCRTTTTTGAGVYSAVSGSKLVVEKSSFSGNLSAGNGGGIYFAGNYGTLYVTNSTFTGNTAAGSLGGFGGGAIYFTGTGTVGYLTNSTLTGNYVYNGALYVAIATMNLKNTIIANNTTVGGNASFVNLFRLSGTIASNGYNIIGSHNVSYFSASTTGDWTDRSGSGTYIQYNDRTVTGTLSLAATTTGESGTMVAPLQEGSIGVDQGGTGSNGPISIPTVDQRSYVRSTTDIGAYEYNASPPDTTAPTVSLTAPSEGATISGSAISLTATASDGVEVAGVKFYVNGTLVGSEDTSSPYATTWNSLATTSGAKTIIAVARDTSNNYATSSSVSVTLDNGPAPVGVTVDTASGSSTVSWTTSVEATTRVFFGLATVLASSTIERDTVTPVTSHAATIFGLSPCAVYRYVAVSKTEANEYATSTESTFETPGCTGTSAITDSGEATVTSSGGSFSEGSLTLTIPASFSLAASSATFQASKLDASTFFDSAGAPSGKTRVGSTVYHLSAYTDASTPLTSFDESIAVSLTYESTDVSGIDTSTLKIFRYDGSSWNELSNCSVNTSSRTVTCTTTQFSDFAIFGTASSGNSASTRTSSGGSSVRNQVENLIAMGNYAYAEKIVNQWSFLFTTEERKKLLGGSASATVSGVVFGRDLFAGTQGEDVKALQNMLIQKGYSIPAGATGYFGAQTWRAVADFQKNNNIFPAAGYFGPKTRGFIEKNR